MRATKTSGANLGPRVRLGATGGQLCPVRLMRSLYPHHHAPDPLNGGPLFAHNGRPIITKAHVVEALQTAVLALGHSDLRISGHSLRATCTSNLVAAGFQERFSQDNAAPGITVEGPMPGPEHVLPGSATHAPGSAPHVHWQPGHKSAQRARRPAEPA
jgi:hypothetical protein